MIRSTFIQNQGAYIAPGIQTGPACPGCQPEAASVVFKESLVLRRSFGIQLEGKDPVGHLYDYRGDSPLHKGIYFETSSQQWQFRNFDYN